MASLRTFLVFLFPTLLLVIILGSSNHYLYTKHQSDQNPNFSYNNDSIPLYDYGHLGIHINPLHVATEVVSHAENRTNSSEMEMALNNAVWLVENAVPFGNSNHSNNNYSLLVYNFPSPAYKVEPPWISAMAQARAVWAMAKVYNITNENKYLDAAKKFLNPLYIDVKNGGVTYKTADNGWWYEEYVFSNNNGTELKPRVLNGMIAIMQDLYRYYEATKDEKAKFLFDKGMIALKNYIHQYDINVSTLQDFYENSNNSQALALLDKGIVALENNTHQYYMNASGLEGYSYYDTLGRLAGESYHKYHVGLLSNLLNLTNDKILKEYHDKWKSYSGPFANGMLYDAD
jgi:heparosan-N-sulfate-glucuronate 5-epimerase